MRNSELIAPRQPVVPITNGLTGRRIRPQRFQLRERDGDATAIPTHSNQHLRFTLLFGSHGIHLLTDAQRRNRTLGFAARFVFPHALISLHLNGVYPHFSLSKSCSTPSFCSLFVGFMST